MNAYDRRTFVKQSAMLAAAAAAARLGLSPALARTARPEQCPPAATPQDHPFFKAQKCIDIIAHRGGAGEWPEETLFALERARARADVLEIDVHATRDNELVLMHDATVDRTTDGAGCIKGYSLDEVSGLNAGHGWPYCCEPRAFKEELECLVRPNRRGERDKECCKVHPFSHLKLRVPTLKRVLDEFKEWRDKRMIIELKEVECGAVEAFCKLLAGYDKEVRERILVASFYDTTVEAVRGDPRCDGAATSAGSCELLELAGGITNKKQLEILGKVLPPCGVIKRAVRLLTCRKKPSPDGGKSHVIAVPANLIAEDRLFVKNARDKYKVKVYAWTVNDPVQMWQMMEAGVDGVITDYPSLMFEWRERWLGRQGE